MRKFSTSLLLTAVITVGFAQTVDKKPEAKKEVLDSLIERLEQRAFLPGVDFKKFREFLVAEQPKIDESKNDEAFRNAVNLALRKFGFSHITIASPKDMAMRSTGKTTGIGISSYLTPEGRVITRVIEKSAASDAGLVPGDIITHVDGKPITDGLNIAGEEGTKVTVRIKREDGKVFDFTLTRRAFSTIQKDTLTFLNPETAILTVHSFERAYLQEDIAKLMEKAVMAKNLIVDLRLNGGGAVINLFHLAGFFLDADVPMGAMLDRTTLNRFKKAKGEDPKELKDLLPFVPEMITPFEQKIGFRGNLVILINQGSASASEIFAASLREQYGKVVQEDGTIAFDPKIGSLQVVGQKSAGAVLFSTYNKLANDFYLQLPVADYITAGGTRLEGNPIVPDVLVDAPPLVLPGKPDKPVEAALALFERTKLRKTRTGSGLSQR